jgi:transcriptional regulator with XRE-family HTH domain
MNKTVKELRKNQGFTAKELAERARVTVNEINGIDALKLRQVPKPLRDKLMPYLNGTYTDKIPWLK